MTIRDYILLCLELDAYLEDQGFPRTERPS